MLDYPERTFTAQYAASMLYDALLTAKGNYVVLINDSHFGRITAEEYASFGADVYCSGNHKCLKHIESLGYKTEYVDRSYDLSASEEKSAWSMQK